MKNIPIESFFLALSVTKLFPHVSFVQSGSLGKVYFADFEFPFSLNDEILSQIQESMKRNIKENLDCKVSDMLPKIAKDYLNHHAKKDLANLVDLDSPMVSIVQIGDFYALSYEEVKNSPVTAHVRVCFCSYYEDDDENKITRIYAISAKDSRELKEIFKEVNIFFKRELINEFRSEKIADLKKDQLFLLSKGRLFKNELINLLEEAIKPFSLQVAESYMEDDLLYDYGVINQLSCKSLVLAPKWESLLFGFLDPLFSVSCEINDDIELKVYNFCKKILDWVSCYKLKLQKEIEIGSEYDKISFKLSDLSYFHVKQLKNKNKMSLKIDIIHPLGSKVRFLKLLIEEKKLKNILRIEAFFHPAAILAWIKDCEIA